MKQLLYLGMIICSLFFLGGCQQKKIEAPIISEEVEKIPVKVIETKKEVMPITLSYMGIVDVDERKNIGFQIGGKISAVYVEKDQYVKKGELLAKLESEDLTYAAQIAKSQMIAAKQQYDKAMVGASQEEINQVKLNVNKAEEAYEYAEEHYERIRQLYEAEGTSNENYEKAAYNLEIAKLELEQVKEAEKQVISGSREEDKEALLAQYKQAETNYLQKQSMVDKANFYADMDGYVVEILHKTGEFIGAGNPVLVMRNEEIIVNVGVTEEDLDDIELGMEVNILSGKKKVKGIVQYISKIPDTSSRTYTVKIDIPQNELNIGGVVQTQIVLGEKEGIWVPLSVIMKDDIDYVYIVNANQIERREVILQDIKEDKILILGVNENEKLVIEGMKKLREGDQVTIVQ